MPTVDARVAMEAMPLGTLFIPTLELDNYDSGGGFALYRKVETANKIWAIWCNNRSEVIRQSENLAHGIDFNIRNGFMPTYKFTIIRYGMEGEIYAPANS